MEASPPHTMSVQPVIVYALYGKANSRELALWQRTWLQGKQFVFVPDAPVGPFAHLYRPVHSGHGKMPKGRGSRQGAPSALFRFKTDANMVWAAHAANASYPEVSCPNPDPNPNPDLDHNPDPSPNPNQV